MPKNIFEDNKRPLQDDREAIQSNLFEYGVSDPKNWRGALDVREENEVKIEEENKRLKMVAEKLIDSFYLDEFDVEKARKENFLAKLPDVVKEEVFKEWFERDPDECLLHVEYFGFLPKNIQPDIAGYIVDHSVSLGDWVYDNVLDAFQEITDQKLQNCFVDNAPYFLLIKNRKKFPLMSDAQFFAKYEWMDIIPYIEQFPTVDKKQVIDGLLRQKSSRPDIFFTYKEKLDLSEREILDLFHEHDKIYEIASKLEYVDDAYHQKVADWCFEEGNLWAIFGYAQHFRKIDVQKLFDGIAKIESIQWKGEKMSGIEIIEKQFLFLPTDWIQQIPQEILNRIVDRNPCLVARVADKFGERINKKELAETIFKMKDFNTLIRESNRLDIVRDVFFAKRVIEAGGARVFLKFLKEFHGLPREIYVQLLEIDQEKVLPYVTNFNGIKKEDIYFALRNFHFSSGVDKIIDDWKSFEGLFLDKEFADILIESSYFEPFVRNIHKFSGLNHQDIVEKALKLLNPLIVIHNLERFKDVNYLELARKLVDAGEYLPVAINLNKFSGIVADRVLGDRLFKGCLALDKWSTSILLNVSQLYKPPLDKDFVLAEELFGDYLTKEIYMIIRDLRDGSIDPHYLRSLGISKSGEEGIRQLRERVMNFRSEILKPSLDEKTLRMIRESDFYGQYFRSYVRFEESEFGEHDKNSFESTTNIHSGGEGLDLAYQPSEEIRVNKIDKDLQASFRYSEQFLSRYETLRRSLENSLELLGEKKPLTRLVEVAEGNREKVLIRLEEKLQQNTRPEAIENIRQRIKKLKSLNFRDIKNFQESFSVLTQFEEFHEDLRKLVFYYALHREREYREKIKGLISKNTPSFDDICLMINFVNHIVNEETWKKYFTERQAAKAFNNLVNIRALEEEFSRAQNQKSQGTTALEFMPTRGLLLEFSGHIADACWASKYENIAKRFPNFSAVILIQNRGTRHERLVGAALLIETKAEDEAPLLVIRGLNPIENLINSLSVEDFFEKFTAYVRGIAERMDPQRQLAIVIDDHSGGSGTNRPVLFNFLEKKKESLRWVRLQSNTDTEFNGYNIVNDTYLV